MPKISFMEDLVWVSSYSGIFFQAFFLGGDKHKLRPGSTFALVNSTHNNVGSTSHNGLIGFHGELGLPGPFYDT
jgi:hypothetical protein